MGNSIPNEYKNIKSLEHMPDCYFVKGKQVHVINNLNYVKSIQSLCGGWHEEMAECINKECVVLKVDDDKAIEIISPSRRKWFFNRAALEPVDFRDYDNIYSFVPGISTRDSLGSQSTPVPTFQYQDKSVGIIGSSIIPQDSPSSVHQPKLPDTTQTRPPPPEFKVGDMLRVSSNEKLIQEKQAVCGGYSKMRMRDLIGKLVYVKYFSPKCVKVEKDGRDYDLHPDILDYPKQEVVKDIENVAKPNCVTGPDKSSDLFSAITNGDVDNLYEKIDIDILDIPNQVGRTPINLACCLGEMEMVEQLVSFGADINIPDKHGNLPIHNCALHGHIEILKHLLDMFPDSLNRQNLNGHSLLVLARQKGNVQLENYLLEKNIDRPPEVKLTVNETSLAISLLTTQSALSALNLDRSRTALGYQINNNSFSMIAPSQSDNAMHFQSVLSSQTCNSNDLERDFKTIDMPKTLKPPQEEIDTSDPAENECTICRDALINIAFVKCGHLSCKACADKIFKCHICNAEIEDRMIIYW